MEKTYFDVEVPVQQDKGLETRDGDEKIGLDDEGSLEKLVVGGPFGGHELLGDGRTEVAILLGQFGGGAVVELAEGAEGEYEIDAAYMAGIIDGSVAVVEVVEDFFELLARIYGAMYVEASEIDIDDAGGKVAVLGEPDIDLCRL